MNTKLSKFIFWSIGFLMPALVAIPAQAAPGILANSPLFTMSNVPPNVFFELDDSGSMDWEILTKNYWHACAYDRDSPGNTGSTDCGGVLNDGLIRIYSGTAFRSYAYIFDNDDNLYNNGCNADDYPKLENCVSDVRNYEWRVRSSDLNVLYYNPNITYLPWQNGDGTAMPDASFTSVRSNPKSGESGYDDTKNLTGFIFEVWSDTHGYNGTRPNRGTNIDRTVGANGLMDYWDEHTRYTVNATSITRDVITYSPTANGTNKGRLNASAASTTLTTGLNGRTLAEEKQNIANWYQYSRRRSFVAKGSIAKVISEKPSFRYGLNTINSSTFFTEVPDLDANFASHNSTLISDLFSFNWPESSTPLRRGLERVGKYFDNTDDRTDPIVQECQQNFALLLTDGYWNGSNPATAIGDADDDGHSRTLADVARYYYTRDLSPLADNVPNSVFDTVNHQHMVTFGVAFGLSGLLTDADGDGWPGTAPGLAEDDDWGDPFDSDPEKIDDLWHAAYNGRGAFVSASSPEAVNSALTTALASIGDRSGSAASVSFNTTTLTGSSAVFLAQFNNLNNKWSGDLLAFALNTTNGDVATTQSWSVNGNPAGAADILDNRANPVTTRTILTHDGGDGIPFQWANLTTAQRNDLLTDPNGTLGTDDAKGQARLNYLRGDRSNEQSLNGTYSFRDRSKLLGDIVNSDPVFVGSPRSAWPDSAPFPITTGNKYSDFAANNINRAEMVYLGANDGMLHGFSAADGSETLAYIPGNLFSSGDPLNGLHYLTDPAYTHRFYVDLASAVEDVYINTGTGTYWHTVLVGGERAGGKGVFALDITNPATFSEANASQIALWEFTNNNDADLGFSFSKPSIGLMPNGRWAAIIGNGYNNTGDGQAKLFILFLDGGLDGVWTPGTDYIEISTGIGSIVNNDCIDPTSDCNGLSTPLAADITGDHVIDRIYAGDLKGNMWAFDVSNSSAANWTVAYSGQPLFIAGKPITSKPALVTHPSQPNGIAPNVLVFFGTGQYLVDTDVTNTDVQAFYGVWDHGTAAITSAQLVEQTFLSNTFTNNGVNVSNRFTVLTNNTVDYATKHGWFIRLTQNTGERVIVDPDVFGDFLFFNTWIPENTVCSAGGSGVLMSIDLVTGGRPEIAPFDLNGDNTIDSTDLLLSGSSTYAATGQIFTRGLPASSSFLTDYQYTPGTSGGSTIEKRRVRPPAPPPTPTPPTPLSNMKRNSWQEIRH
ncbi:pilus assembly protein [Methylomonas rivi]|uniref:PilC/PilY family type IV pilus protein n=1 Tax=Methylomonas rivi TaxID=2952226 RepID=A0ABT1U0D0_9GAMM|nr:PilC/PilY family type IV pilus protein [Methylomonas sp. WSC-6]MCQ8127276.1 PilC/PilY family type IV pilus protein [Methylomonas sp. WSC-6]